MHRHGNYHRYAHPTGAEKFAVSRFLCVRCGHTVSVLPPNRLTYRSLQVHRLQGAFDAQAKVSSGLDPPPEPVEAGCLQRAWTRFLTRVDSLTHAFGQIVSAGAHSAPQLWKELRRSLGSAEQMLRFLAQSCKRSLLGDYTCLRVAEFRPDPLPSVGTVATSRGPPIPQKGRI
jgi:hypothetical protein